MISLSELKELIELLKSERITYFRSDDLVLKLELPPSPQLSDMLEKVIKANDYTDDEILIDPFVGLDQNTTEGILDGEPDTR